jgi:indole-3-glycerol phosphate synthase
VRQTQRLLPLCPSGSLVISESGLFEAGQLTALQALGVRGALAGESLVTAADIGQKVRQMALV